MKPNCSSKNSGFTLVELLVVMAVIVILASALFMVINPVQVQRKSKEAVLKARVSQLCSALSACGATKSDARQCDTYLELGAANPTGEPLNAVYVFPVVVDPAATVTISGSYPSGATNCTYSCTLNFGTGVAVPLSQTGACL
ncbi:type II secretion system GspH family protein [Patescibacteria group bacterium]|nr:type II secretion system GspH family protein [Patescibacteria group bacterium]MBU1970571.1 type II secretion system GspH family protein [Patescibacteria group bacterium]